MHARRRRRRPLRPPRPGFPRDLHGHERPRARGARHRPPRGGVDRVRRRRPLAAVLDEVRDLVKYRPAPLMAVDMARAAEPLSAAVSSPDLGFTLRPIIPLRWFEPDSGLPVTMKFNPTNAPSVVPGGARA